MFLHSLRKKKRMHSSTNSRWPITKKQNHRIKSAELCQESSNPVENFDHLTDNIDEKEKTKETLKNGLLSFLKYVEKVEDEKLPNRK
jgi:hypothetical protein